MFCEMYSSHLEKIHGMMLHGMAKQITYSKCEFSNVESVQ